LKSVKKALPVLVFRIDWSRKPLKFCASGASSEPDVALETAHVGPVGNVTVDLVLVEPVLVAVLVF
jgi:hypothetical protein